MASKYETVSEATISWDEPTDAWRLEIWADGNPTALAMWPLQDLNGLDADAYAAAKILLQQVGIYDQGRESWHEQDGRWSAAVLPRPYA
jgi:hypothetical protein